MTVSNATPKVQFTGNNSTSEFNFNFVVPASLSTGEITDSTAGITQGTTTLTVATADLFYTSDLQGKTITIAGAGAGSSTLTTTIVTVNSATNVTIADAASVTVSSAAIVVTTGQTGTTLKNDNEIEVFVDSTKQTIGSSNNYTVRLNVGDDINKQGTVIFNTGSIPASATTVTIARNIELSRTSDFQSGGALTAKELNAQFDNVVMAVQDQKNDDDRFIQFPPDEPSSTSGVLPDANTRAGKFFAFDTNGDITLGNTVNLPNASLIVSSVAANSGDITQFNATTGTITNLTSNNVDFSGGLIDSTSIGSNTPSTGAFTTLTASGEALFPAVNINGGTIDGATIGADSPADGTFANVTINGTLNNTGGNFVLGSIFATGTDGLRTKKVRSETANELSIESQSNQDISITTDGIGKLNLKSPDIQINPTGTKSTTVGGRTYTGNMITSDNDLIFNTYNSPGNGITKFLSNDGIHIDGTNPKVKGQLQLQLEDGSAVNNILISNSSDSDTPGIQINTHQNSHTKIGQVQYPPQMQQQTGSISVGAYPRLQYKKTLVFGLSGQSFQYPEAKVGDKFVRSGSVDDFGFITKAVTAGSTTSSIQYEVLTNKQTWGQGVYFVVDEASQTLGFTSGAGTPQISTQNNDTDFYIGWDNSSNANNLGITSDSVNEGSTNLYFTDARADARISQASIGSLFNVSTSSLQNGDVIAYNSSNGLFENGPQTSAPVTSVAGKTGSVILTSDDIAGGGSAQFYTEAQFNSSLASKTTDNVVEGSGNLYFTNERVDDRVSNLLLGGTGISISYNDLGNSLTITNTDAGTTIVNDTSPQLGNGLDVNGHEIFSLSNADIKIQPHGNGATLFGSDNTNTEISTNGTGDLLLRTNGSTTTAAANSSQIKINDGTDGDIEITPHGDGQIDLDSYVWPKNGLGGAGQFLKINTLAGGVAQLAWASGTASGMNDIVEDTTPQLGGDLDTQTNSLSGTDIIPSTGTNGGFNSGGSAVRLLSSGVTTHDHAIRTAADSGRQNISFITDSTGSFSASQTSSGGSKSGSGLIYSPLNMQVRDRGESTKTRTTFDVGVPYIGNTGSTITASGGATGKLLDVVAGDYKVYLMQTSGTFTATETLSGVVTGTITNVDTSLGTNAVILTIDSSNFATTAAQSDLASVGLARFSARDVLNTSGMRTSEPELHFEAGRIAFESNGTKQIDIADAGGMTLTTRSNGNIDVTPNGTGQVRIDTDLTEQHSTKGLIIHDGAQGTYLDLTGSGANIGPLYGAGIHAEETNGGAQLSLFSHKTNGATTYPNLWAHRSRDDGSGNKDYLDNDDIVFSFFGAAWDGNTGGGEGTFRKTAAVELRASENHSSSAGGGKIEFHTVDNGTQSYTGTKRLTIDDNIELNTPLDVNGQTILSSSNGNITIEPHGTGSLNMKRVRLGQGDSGIAIRSSDFADMADFVRESTSHYSYSLQVASDSTTNALAAGNAGGAFGFTAMSDSYSPNNNQFYIGSINGVIGDTGNLDGSTAGENNNAIRMYTYSDNVGYALNNVGEFRHGTTKLMNEKLVFSESSNNITVSTTSNGDINFTPNGTGEVKVNGDLVQANKSYATWKLNSNMNTNTSTNITDMTIINSANITHSSGTFTVTKAGLYQINFTGTFITSGGERQVGVTIKINGSGVLSARDQVADVESGNNFGAATVNVVQELAVGDTINFEINQSYADGNISAYADQTNGTICKVA